MIDTPCQLPDLPPVLKVIPMPSDANMYGDVFGGWTMGHIDLAGAVLGHKVARGRIATVAVNTIQFHQPVSVGDIVTFFAEVEKRGRTSVTIKVQMYAERHPENPDYRESHGSADYLRGAQRGRQQARAAARVMRL